MVNSLNGFSAAEYQTYLKVQNTMLQSGQTNPVNLTYANDSVSFSGSQCTDGKDDGKIGLFAAVGNAVVGVGHTLENGIKGMFTGQDGKFSLGKTLLSVGTAAACIAFPAVGVAACVVGGAMGAVQIGKGAIKAATAQTDAEAKQAWQDIGGGAFTVGASVVGAKAGVKAVKTTAGPNSALASLDDAATMGQKAAALGKDMISSTKNQGIKIGKAAAPYAEAAKVKAAQIKASKIKNTGALTPDELHSINNAKYQEMFASDKAKAILSQADDITATAKGYVEAAKVKSAQIKANKIKNTGALTPDELHTINNAKYQEMFASDKAKAVLSQMDDFSSTVKSYGEAAKVKSAQIKASKIKNTGALTPDELHTINNAKYQEMFASDKAKAVLSQIDDLTAQLNKLKGKDLSQLSSKLTGTAKNIWQDLSTGKHSYPEVVNKYGFENVAEVVKYMSGTALST